MATEMQETIRVAAIEWHIRLRHADDADWDAFADWLAEDPAHAEMYDRIEQADLDIAPLLPDLVFRTAANDTDAERRSSAPSRRRWFLGGGALAASIASAIWLAPDVLSQHYEVATAAGQTRIVVLDPATRITLNGATRMTFDHGNPRFAALTAGEALFDIRHDRASPFRLDIGNDRVEDAGTTFNVVRDGGGVRIAVAEGKVVYNPGSEAISLDAGQGLVRQAGNGGIRLVRMPPAVVGAWQRKQLIYRGEPLSRIAEDLSRALGVRIVVSPAIADRTFHATIAIDGSRPEVFARLRRALDVDLEAGSGGWTMKPRDRGKR